MTKILIVTRARCPYCTKAMKLFDEKQLAFEEITVESKSTEWKEELFSKTKQRTFPQIFINNEFIGGCSELVEKQKTTGFLDTLSSSSEAS